MYSMTGFGRSELETEAGKVVIEAKSENHRFLDIYLQLPENLSPLEGSLTELIKKSVNRGKLRVSIVAQGLRSKPPGINLEAARKAIEALKTLKEEFGIKGDIRLEHLLMIRELFTADEKPPVSADFALQIEEGLKEAIHTLNKMRKSEGGKLRRDLRKRIGRLEKLIDEIDHKRESFSEQATGKLRERIQKLLIGVPMDETRLIQEVAFLADRSDITEEIVRLKAHTARFSENLERRDPVGRELDFLTQEMNREATTIAAKAKDAEISHLVVELKSELERIREQVQNIE